MLRSGRGVLCAYLFDFWLFFFREDFSWVCFRALGFGFMCGTRPGHAPFSITRSSPAVVNLAFGAALNWQIAAALAATLASGRPKIPAARCGGDGKGGDVETELRAACKKQTQRGMQEREARSAAAESNWRSLPCLKSLGRNRALINPGGLWG